MVNAASILQAANLKATPSRLDVVGVLASSDFPLSHPDILKQLPSEFDRVTLYRVLDWLLQHNVVHRIAGDDRAWRFQLNAPQYSAALLKKPFNINSKASQQHAHAHFQCTVCSKIFCLEDVHPKLSSSIPAQFTVDSIELKIKGCCADCHGGSFKNS